jgi:hypothetical protein
MSKTKKQRKRRGKLLYTTRDIKSKLGHGQGGKLHGSAKRIDESLDKEREIC